MDDVASNPLMTVIEFFHGSRGFSVKGSSESSPGSIAQCAGSQPCGLKIPTNRGVFPVASAFADGTKAGNIDSSSGSAMVAPAPCKNVRRGICFFVMNMSLLLKRLPVHLKRSALRDFQNNRREAVIVLRCLAHYGSYHRHVVVLYSAAQRIGKKLFRDGAHELRGITQQALPQADHAVDLAAVDKLACRIEFLSGFFRTPLSNPVQLSH